MTISPTEFFKKYGLAPKRFSGGLLAVFSNEPCEDPHATMFAIMLEGEFEGAIFTCFCETEAELMAAVTTSIKVSDYMRELRAACRFDFSIKTNTFLL